MENKGFRVVVFVGIVSLLLMGLSYPNLQEPWKAPEWTDGLKSTLKISPELLAEGEQLYNTNCVTCHGKPVWEMVFLAGNYP